MLSLPTRPPRPLAWGTLLATLALLGATPVLGAHLAATVGGDPGSPEVSASQTVDQTTTVDQASTDGDLSSATPCGTPGPSALSTGSNSPVVAQPGAAVAQPGAAAVGQAPASAAASSDLQASFRLCGGSDAPTARALEQLIAGRSFSASLNSRSADTCADLTIHVAPQAAAAGSQTISLSVSAGSPARPITVQITSENGATHASIGGGQ
jgi:hypothetical protein